MATWVEALAQHLEQNSLGTRGTSIYIGLMPDNYVVTTMLTPYSGRIVETMASGTAINVPQLQVRVRGDVEDFATPQARAEAVKNLFALITNTTINGVVFLRVKPSSTVASMGRDENKRWEFVVNFEVSLG